MMRPLAKPYAEFDRHGAYPDREPSRRRDKGTPWVSDLNVRATYWSYRSHAMFKADAHRRLNTRTTPERSNEATRSPTLFSSAGWKYTLCHIHNILAAFRCKPEVSH